MTETATIERPRIAVGFEDVDTSIANSVKCAVHLGSHIVKTVLGIEYRVEGDHQPVRHVELDPDFVLLATADSGMQSELDVYNLEALDSGVAPLLMSKGLFVPHDKGIGAPYIRNMAEFCAKEGRAVIVQSSGGFAGKKPTHSQVRNFTFNTMAHNSLDYIDRLSKHFGLPITEMEVAGDSQGATNSLLMSTVEVRDQRHEERKNHIQIVGATAITPAGLKRIGLTAAKQLLVDEPLYEVLKASGMDSGTLKQYGRAISETISPPVQALPILAKTALLYVLTKPLENIAERLDPDTTVDIAVMDKDGMTSPGLWKDEMANHPNSNVVILPGHHSSSGSLRKVGKMHKFHLQGYKVYVDNSLAVAA